MALKSEVASDAVLTAITLPCPASLSLLASETIGAAVSLPVCTAAASNIVHMP